MKGNSVLVPRTAREVLMELQYRFPRSATPYCDAARALGMSADEVIRALREQRRAGILKRVGFYVNYRSERLRAALLAIAASERVEEIAHKVFSSDPHATHVYERNHPVYNLWVVTKRPSEAELVELAREVRDRFGADVILLYGKKTWKLSVKYDLNKGVSRSGPYWRVSQAPPTPEAYGLRPGQIRLFRSLPVEPHPYRRIAGKLGLSEEETARLAWRMLEDGALGDPGAALDGHKAGFRVNIMLTARAPDPEETCSCMAQNPHTTHVVYRRVYPEGKWRLPCYAMLHATTRSLAEGLVKQVVDSCSIEEYFLLESIRDLKPGVVR